MATEQPKARSRRALLAAAAGAAGALAANAAMPLAAAAADVRVACPSARIAFLFTRVGLAGADMGAAWLLPRIVGYGRAEKAQVQSMVQLLLGLTVPPTPFDASDALAIAVCHLHKINGQIIEVASRARKSAGRATSWRAFRPPR